MKSLISYLRGSLKNTSFFWACGKGGLNKFGLFQLKGRKKPDEQRLVYTPMVKGFDELEP